jgi:hypothetical protein
MKHSEPILLILFIPLTTILIVFAVLMIGLYGLLTYPFMGFLIWVVCSGEPNFLKALLLWWPAIALDKPEMLE